ncbi:MAG: hypothetical protein U9N46_03850 [Euryarchaeota archaeon]|nr:MAG: hypothetical protein C5S48_00305 [ANME-2 cluster archaeon]MEA1864318.1 hypothetical protein [Euryarchaeota archaeon]
MKKIKNINGGIKKDVILNMGETIAAEIEFYNQVLKKFESRYGDLAEFGSRIANAELPEHPYWGGNPSNTETHTKNYWV